MLLHSGYAIVIAGVLVYDVGDIRLVGMRDCMSSV